MARSIVLAVESQAPAGDIFSAITTEEGLASFWTSDVTASPEVGSVIRLGFPEAPVDLEMEIAELEQDELVAWSCRGPWPNWTGTRVEWRIADMESGTRIVVFRHEGWPDEQPDAEFGSVGLVWARVLLALEGYVRTGDRQPALG